MLKFRYNWQRQCWEQYGFLRGAIVPVWKWIAVEAAWVKECISKKVGAVSIDETIGV